MKLAMPCPLCDVLIDLTPQDVAPMIHNGDEVVFQVSIEKLSDHLAEAHRLARRQVSAGPSACTRCDSLDLRYSIGRWLCGNCPAMGPVGPHGEVLPGGGAIAVRTDPDAFRTI